MRLTLLFTLLTLSSFAQTTLTFNTGSQLTGTVLKERKHTLSLLSADSVVYTVQKGYLTAAPGINLNTCPAIPAFKDQRYYLRTAGTQGIIAGSVIIGSSALLAIGYFTGNNNISALGGVTIGTGFVLTIPAFVFLSRSGKVPYHRSQP